jgi:hypothetical protein
VGDAEGTDGPVDSAMSTEALVMSGMGTVSFTALTPPILVLAQEEVGRKQQ